MDTPSEHLAAKILERLIAEKLLTENDRKKLLAKLGNGDLKPEDWRLAVELAGSKGGKT
jgi:hypothetical protein